MTKKQLATEAVLRLSEKYPKAECSLIYNKPYELLFATRLSAQCTDARVNIVTKVLYKKYTTLEQIADADVHDVEEIIKSCGLYKTKAESIVKAAQMLRDIYGGILPDSIEELTKLPGIGRKTANLIVGDVYGQPSVVTDTHCIRICNRLGLVNVTDPYKVELALKKLLDPKESGDFCHRLVHFGREICSARAPKCDICPLNNSCKNKVN